MSMFLPEGFGQQAQPQDGVAAITPSSPETTSEDIALMQRVLSAAARNPNLIPSDFMSYIVDYIQTSRLSIPIGQVFGFTKFAPNLPIIATGDATGSTTYTDLADVGPELTTLGNGGYILLYGCLIVAATGTPGKAYMSPSINGVSPSDVDAATLTNNGLTPGQTVFATIKTLNDPSGLNSVVMKYKITGAASSSTFSNRWLLAMKYA